MTSHVKDEDEILLLRKIYRKLIDSGFLREEGLPKEELDSYFQRIAGLLKADSVRETGKQSLILYSDGASRGNPGNAGIGFVIQDGSKETLEASSRFIGVATNNVAEYSALLEGLEAARKFQAREIRILSDSSLLVHQIRGEWRIKSAELLPYAQKARDLLRQYKNWEILHIPREENTIADRLANEGIDGALRK